MGGSRLPGSGKGRGTGHGDHGTPFLVAELVKFPTLIGFEKLLIRSRCRVPELSNQKLGDVKVCVV